MTNMKYVDLLFTKNWFMVKNILKYEGRSAG